MTSISFNLGHRQLWRLTRARKALGLLSLTCLVSTSYARVLDVANPIDAGVDPKRLQHIETAINKAIAAREIPGAVVLIARKGSIVYHESFGFADIASGKSMEKDSIFRIASMTKVITSVGIMMLYERGHFLLADPLSNYISEFSNPRVVVEVDDNGEVLSTRPARKEIRILDLLTHSSGIAYPFVPSDTNRSYIRAGIIDGFTSKPISVEANVRRIAKQPLLFDPGSAFAYGLSTDVLGYLIEVLTDKTLDVFFREEIFEPLEMHDTHFYLPAEKADRLVTLYADPEGAGVAPAQGDEGIIRLDNPNFPVEGARAHFSGGGGLSSTALDYANFLYMLLNDGEFNGKRLLSRKSIELMRTSRSDRDGDGAADFGLGLQIVESLDRGTELASVGAYSWGGFFYTYFWVDPQEQLITIFLSQVVYPVHSGIRDIISVLSYQALE